MTCDAARRAEAVVVKRATAITSRNSSQNLGQSARSKPVGHASLYLPRESREIPALVASVALLDARDALAHARQRRWDDATNRGVYQLDGMQRRDVVPQTLQRGGDLQQATSIRGD